MSNQTVIRNLDRIKSMVKTKLMMMATEDIDIYSAVGSMDTALKNMAMEIESDPLEHEQLLKECVNLIAYAFVLQEQFGCIDHVLKSKR